MLERHLPRPDRADTTLTFTHPDDVLNEGRLSTDEKRAILATWASDAHSVPDQPALRQLESGAIVPVDDVLAALRALDATEQAHEPTKIRWLRRRPRPSCRGLRSARRRDDDDDDPPPCPVAAKPPAPARPLDDVLALAA